MESQKQPKKPSVVRSSSKKLTFSDKQFAQRQFLEQRCKLNGKSCYFVSHGMRAACESCAIPEQFMQKQQSKVVNKN